MRFILCFIAAVIISFMTIDAADFTSRDIIIDNNTQNIRLGATITVPDGRQPLAAIVLATGSGAQNRDEEVLDHKPFKAIAEYLSANGYAVLRFDDRGVGESTGDPASMTTDNYVTDITACLGWLKDSVDNHIPTGVLGHSQGGSAAIKLGGVDSTCDFIITIGAPAWSGDSIIMSQSRAVTMAMAGKWDGEALQRRLMDLVKGDTPSILLGPLLYSEIAAQLGDMAKMPDVQKQLLAQTNAMCSATYRDLVKYDPARDIAAVSVPWLALNGDRDMQVLPDNLVTIKELNPKADTRLLPRHNHLMQQCNTGMPQEYASIAEDISSLTLETILSWLNSHFAGL